MDHKRNPIRTDHVLVAVMLFLMALIAFVNVLSRYLFHFSLAATEEITINLFVWMTVVGTGIAFERGAQLGMVTLFNRFPAAGKKAVVILSAVLGAALFILVDYFMIRSIIQEMTIFKATSGALGIPVWIYYAGVPLCSVFVFRGMYRNMVYQIESLSE